MASLTSVLNLIKEKDSSERRSAQAVTPTKAQPAFNDYSLGTAPAGGLDTIKKYYGTLGQQGQRSEQRRLEQAGLSNIIDETNRTNSRNFGLKREEGRGANRDLIVKQSLLDEALAKIQNYIEPTEGTPEVPYQAAVPEVRRPAIPATEGTPEVLIPGINAPLATTLYGGKNPFGWLKYGMDGEYATVTQPQLTNDFASEYPDLSYGTYSGLRGGSSENPTTYTITPDILTDIFGKNQQLSKLGILGGTNLGGATVDPLIILRMLQQGYLTPEQINNHISGVKTYRGDNLSSYESQALKNLADLQSINSTDFFTESKIPAVSGTPVEPEYFVPGTEEIPYQPAVPGLPGSPYSLEDQEKLAYGDPLLGTSGLQGQVGGLNDILGKLSEKYKPIDKQFDFSRFNLTDPLQSPGRPEENFLRRNLKGAVVTPKAK